MLLHWFFPQEISFSNKRKVLVFIIGFNNPAASLWYWFCESWRMSYIFHVGLCQTYQEKNLGWYLMSWMIVMTSRYIHLLQLLVRLNSRNLYFYLFLFFISELKTILHHQFEKSFFGVKIVLVVIVLNLVIYVFGVIYMIVNNCIQHPLRHIRIRYVVCNLCEYKEIDILVVQ